MIMDGLLMRLILIPSYIEMYGFQLAENLLHAYYHIRNIGHYHDRDDLTGFTMYRRTS